MKSQDRPRNIQVDKKQFADEVAAKYIENQDGDALIRQLGLCGPDRVEFDVFMYHIAAPDHYSLRSMESLESGSRQQRLLYGTICALLSDHNKHDARKLARFVVHVILKYRADRSRCRTWKQRRSIICKRLRLPSRLHGRKNCGLRRLVRRYDRLFFAVLARRDLRDALWSFLSRNNPDFMRTLLEKIFLFVATQARPSIAQSVMDIRALHHAVLDENHSNACCEINQMIAKAKAGRGEAFDESEWLRHEGRDTGKGTIDRLDRLARSKLGIVQS